MKLRSSGEFPADENPALREAVELAIKASNLRRQDHQQALHLMNEAIALVEHAELPAFHFRLMRELIRLGNSSDISTLVPILEEKVEYYTLEGNVLEQVDALLNLFDVLYRLEKYPQALNCLNQASSIIEGLSISQISELDERAQHRSISMSTLLHLRLAGISRRRALIEGL